MCGQLYSTVLPADHLFASLHLNHMTCTASIYTPNCNLCARMMQNWGHMGLRVLGSGQGKSLKFEAGSQFAAMARYSSAAMSKC